MSQRFYTEREKLLDDFFLWELPGRGIQVWGLPVFPEPQFQPFRGHWLPVSPAPQIEIPPPLLVRFFDNIVDAFTDSPKTPVAVPPVIDATPILPDKSFFDFTHRKIIELEITLPQAETISRDLCEQFLLGLSFCRHPVSFEVVGTAGSIHIQFAVDEADAALIQQQLSAHFPSVCITKNDRLLADLLLGPEEPFGGFAEFRLAHEFMRPLATVRNLTADPLVGITGALAGLREKEVGVFQVIFQPVKHPWAESMLRAVTWEDGSPFLDSTLVAQTRQKTSRPLFATAIRVLGQSSSVERGEEIARGLAAALSAFSEPSSNELVTLENLELEFLEMCGDVIRRRIRHSGMILNSDEIVSLVHPPSPSVKTSKLRRETEKTKAAPAIACGHRLILGSNESDGETNSVTLSSDHRVRHMHVLGASGTGKSTFLLNLIRQDIENGEGLALLDPHGDLVDAVLADIPESRIDDVILIDPSDAEFPVGFNILSAHSELEKNLLASDLIAVFQRLSTSWGDQMNSVFANAILAFLESERGGTLADLRRFLVEKEFRADFLTTVKDPEVVYYWTKQYPLLKGVPQAPLLTRLDTFLRPKPIRYMVSQHANRINFAEIMDERKIFLAKLAQGAIGEENAYLLGTLLVSKFHQLAIGRQQLEEAQRQYFWCYIDECHHFVTPSMASILSGARKYRLGLVLAHQELSQLQHCSDVASAIVTNPYTRICFRLGSEDARKFSDEFSFFDAKDLQNLGIGEAIGRIERSDFDFNLAVPFREKRDPNEALRRRQEVITASRRKYAMPRAEVETILKSVITTKPDVDNKPPPTAPPIAPAVSEPPKPPPIPKTTVSGEKEMVTAPSKAEPPRDLGRGGAQHKAIQLRIKHAAEELGFRSVIERPILDGQGSVDLWLERDGQGIACEISVTTTIDHEVGNVAKCLKAGVPNVAVICVDESRLRKIASAVLGSLGAESAGRVEYFEPDQFIANLKTLPVETPTEQTRVSRGYKVKRVVSEFSEAKRKEREAAAIRAIADSMRKR